MLRNTSSAKSRSGAAASGRRAVKKVADRPVSVRLPDQSVQQLTALAIVDGGNVADQIREAIAGYLSEGKSDPKLIEAVEDARRRRVELLDTLV